MEIKDIDDLKQALRDLKREKESKQRELTQLDMEIQSNEELLRALVHQENFFGAIETGPNHTAIDNFRDTEIEEE